MKRSRTPEIVSAAVGPAEANVTAGEVAVRIEFSPGTVKRWILVATYFCDGAPSFQKKDRFADRAAAIAAAARTLTSHDARTHEALSAYVKVSDAIRAEYGELVASVAPTATSGPDHG